MTKKDIETYFSFARNYCRERSVDYKGIEATVKKIIDRSVSIEFWEGTVESYQILGMIHMGKKDQEMALTALKMSEALIQKYHLPEVAYLKLYEVYAYWYLEIIGDIESAVSTCDKGIALARRVDDKKWQTVFTVVLGKTCVHLGKSEEALSLLEPSVPFVESGKDRKLFSEVHLVIGEACFGLAKDHEGLAHLSVAGNEALALQDGRTLERAYLDISHYYRGKGEFKKAIKQLESVCRELIAKEALVLGCDLCLEIVTLYLKNADYLMADIWIKEYEDALIAKEKSFRNQKFYRLKSEIYVGFGDYKKAYIMAAKSQTLDETSSHQRLLAFSKKTYNVPHIHEVRYLETVSFIGQHLLKSPSVEQMLRHIYSSVAPLLAVDAVGIGIKENDRISYGCFQPDLDQFASYTIPLNETGGIMNWAITQKKPVLISDYSLEYVLYNDRLRNKIGKISGKVPRSVICIPLENHKEVIGLLLVQAYDPMAFTKKELEMFKAISVVLTANITPDQ